MTGASKVIMGATLVMVVSLAIVLGLVMVLLAELYCSLLLRRRQLRTTATSTTPTTTDASRSHPSQPLDPSGAPPGNFYGQGVLGAPRSFLFPSVPIKDDKTELKKQHSQILQILEGQLQESSTAPPRIGLVSSSSPSSKPEPIQEIPLQVSSGSCNDGACHGEHFVYISNPIYDNDAGRPSRVGTPFETPDSSPSRLEMEGSSGEDERAQDQESPITPPLTPMKKLPAEACSVSLRDVRSLGTSGSDSNGNNGLSSSSSGSPCTSPSW